MHVMCIFFMVFEPKPALTKITRKHASKAGLFLDYFNVLMLKIIFLKIKKYYFNIFLHKKK
jgi:hypothetical protein